MAAGDEYFEDLLKIEIGYSGDRNTAANVLYASCPDAHGASVDSLITLATSLAEYFAANIMPLVTEHVILETLGVSDWTSADGLSGGYDDGTAGSLTGGTLPAQVCTLINGITNIRYRGGHMRMYLPPPDSTKVESNTAWTSAFVSAMDGAIEGFFSYLADQSLGSGAITPVLYHRAGNKDIDQGFEDIIAVGCNGVAGTQRRRIRRVGHKA